MATKKKQSKKKAAKKTPAQATKKKAARSGAPATKKTAAKKSASKSGTAKAPTKTKDTHSPSDTAPATESQSVSVELNKQATRGLKGVAEHAVTSVRSLHIWDFVWLRDLFVLGMFVLLLWFMYSERAITLPVLFGLLLAYLFNPWVTKLDKQYNVSRTVSAAAILLIGVCIVAATVRIVVPPLVNELTDESNRKSLITGINNVRETLIDAGLVHDDPSPKSKPNAIAEAVDAANPTTTPQLAEGVERKRQMLLSVLGIGYGVVTSLFDGLVYAALFVTLVAFCFFFFTRDFSNTVRWFAQFIPSKHRPDVEHIVKRMDKAVSGFVRGRLIQCLFMGINLSIGFSLLGWIDSDLAVPYAILLGILGGVFTIVPYAFWLSGIAAVALCWISHKSGSAELDVTTAVLITVAPLIVLAIANTIDAFCIEPLVQSKATNLSPLAILIAVLIGGSVGGLLGLLIAIPLTSCIRILGEEVLIPHFKRYVEDLP